MAELSVHTVTPERTPRDNTITTAEAETETDTEDERDLSILSIQLDPPPVPPSRVLRVRAHGDVNPIGHGMESDRRMSSFLLQNGLGDASPRAQRDPPTDSDADTAFDFDSATEAEAAIHTARRMRQRADLSSLESTPRSPTMQEHVKRAQQKARGKAVEFLQPVVPSLRLGEMSDPVAAANGPCDSDIDPNDTHDTYDDSEATEDGDGGGCSNRDGPVDEKIHVIPQQPLDRTAPDSRLRVQTRKTHTSRDDTGGTTSEEEYSHYDLHVSREGVQQPKTPRTPGRRTPPPTFLWPFSAYCHRMVTCPLNMHHRCLVFTGDNIWSLCYHMGLVSYYLEARLLPTVTHLFAVQYSIPLAFLLKVHWIQLLKEPAVYHTDLIYDTITRPLVMLMINPVAMWYQLLSTHLRRLVARWPSKDECREMGLPLSHFVLSKDPSCVDMEQNVAVYFDDDALAGMSLAEACIQVLAYFDLDSDQRSGKGIIVRSPWTVLLESLKEMASDADTHLEHDSQRQFHLGVSYAGRQPPPPIRKGNVPCADPSLIQSFFEFAGMFWMVAENQPLSNHMQLIVYSVHHGGDTSTTSAKDYKHSDMEHMHTDPRTRKKRNVLQKIRKLSPNPPVAPKELNEVVNWGFIVSMLVETHIGKRLGYIHNFRPNRRDLLNVHPPGKPAMTRYVFAETKVVFEPDEVEPGPAHTRIKQAEEDPRFPAPVDNGRCGFCNKMRRSFTRQSA